MRKLKKLLYILFIVFGLCYHSFAATYFVDQYSGDGDDTGSSYANRASIAYHNAGSGFFGGVLDNDTVYLCGAITTPVVAQDGGADNDNRVTYDGTCPGGSQGTIAVAGTSTGFSFGGEDYVTLNNIHITLAKVCLFGGGSLGVINTGITLTNSTISGCYESGFLVKYLDDTIIDGNTFSDCGSGTTGVDINLNTQSTNTIVRNNVLHGNGVDEGVDGIVAERSFYALIENNRIYDHFREDGIDIKKDSTDFIIRYNEIYGNTQSGITIQMGSHDIQIYGNRVYNNGWAGIYLKRGCEGSADMHSIDIWSNISFNNASGIYIASSGGSSCGGPTNLDDVGIYNNVVAFNGGSLTQRAGIGIQTGTGHIIKNNILYGNFSGANAYEQLYLNGANYSTNTAYAWFDNNMYYTPGSSAEDIVTVSGVANYTFAEFQGLNAGVNEVAGSEEDPTFTTPGVTGQGNGTENDDYRLQAGSPAIVNGEDVSGCWGVAILGTQYMVCRDDGVDPLNTVFTDSPPVVVTVKQDPDWDQGAYIYLGAVVPPQFSTAVIASTGTTITVTFDTDAYDGASYADAHWDVDCDTAGDDVALTYVSGKDSSAWVFTLGTTILSGEACHIDFDGTANSMENSVGDDMAALVSGAVTNNSVQTAGAPTGQTSTVGSGQTISVPGTETVTVE